MSAKRWAFATAPTSSARAGSCARDRPTKLFIMKASGRSTSGSTSGSDRPSAMKPTLQLKLSQHLTLTPQLQQSIRLLQLSTLELNAEVERLLQENPLLEKADEEEGTAPPPEFMQTLATAPATAE